MNPLVSIIVPCYNAASYIDRCVDSLVNQTIGLENLEIILVNDASTDSTYEKLLEWERQYPDSILVIHSSENLRQGGARNLGVSYARGAYIAFVDADDWIDLNMYKAMTEKAISYDCDLVSCNFDRPTSGGDIMPGSNFSEAFIHIESEEDRKAYLLSHRSATMAPLSIYKRNWYLENEICFPEGLLYEDHIMFFVYACARRIYVLNESFYHYYKNEASVTSTCKNPLDRIPVHEYLYSRLAKPEFSGIKDLVDYNFYEKGIAETVFCDASILSDLSTVLHLKKILFEYIPDIFENPYYCHDLPLPSVSMELLLHPLLENDITNDVFSLFLKRVLYCIEYPEVLFFADQLALVHRKLYVALRDHMLAADTLSEISVSLHSICSQYNSKQYAQKNKISAFYKQISALCSDPSSGEHLLDLIDNLAFSITLPTGHS